MQVRQPQLIAYLVLLGAALSGCGGNASPTPTLPSLPAPVASQNPTAINSLPISLKEFPIPAGQVISPWIAIGSDGAVWFNTSTGVDALNGAGTVRSYSLPPLTGYAFIAGTRTGNVFVMGSCPFGRPDLGSFQGIYNVSTTGVFSPDTTDCGAVGEPAESDIVALKTSPGGDDVVVARNFSGDATVSGSSGGLPFFATFSGEHIATLTSGPENSVYVTGISSSDQTFIAQVPPKTQSFPTPFLLPFPAFVNISDMAAGADGNIWLVEPSRNVIARISPSFSGYTEFSIPTPNAGLNRIVAAPDGALYFTESMAGKIGRITTDGKIMEFATPGAPEGITACPILCEGAHVRLFVTEDTNKVLRFEY